MWHAVRACLLGIRVGAEQRRSQGVREAAHAAVSLFFSSGGGMDCLIPGRSAVKMSPCRVWVAQCCLHGSPGYV